VSQQWHRTLESADFQPRKKDGLLYMQSQQKIAKKTVTVRMNVCDYNQKHDSLRILLVLSTHRPRSVYKSHRKLAKGRVEVDRG